MGRLHQARDGFTLIELSIVLVIIGLIVGGVLVGQNLIAAAGVRATISQIEKYNTAVNTFRDKYGGLPGDLNASLAAQFGFKARGQYGGEGDGNGILQTNIACTSGGGSYYAENGGETGLFWVDLSQAHLIDDVFSTATSCVPNGISDPNLYYPQAKLGGGNYIYVWSGGWGAGGWPVSSPDGNNYFSLSAITMLNEDLLDSQPGLTVGQAYAIDQKTDDGLPQSGHVIALYLNDGNGVLATWAAGGGAIGARQDSPDDTNAPTTAATAGSATTCYDNSSAASGTPGVAGAIQHYSLEMKGGSNVNCALSFRFQ